MAGSVPFDNRIFIDAAGNFYAAYGGAPHGARKVFEPTPYVPSGRWHAQLP